MNSSITTSAPAVAEAAVEHRVERGLGLGVGRGDDHALARGEAVGLDHTGGRSGRAPPSRRRASGARAIARRSGCRRAAHRSLVKPLRAFELRRGLGRAEHRDPRGAQRRRRGPSTSGASGPTTTRSIALRRQKSITARVVGHVERDQLGMLGDARIAGRGVELCVEQAAIARASTPAHVRGRPIRAAGHSCPTHLLERHWPATTGAAGSRRPAGRQRARRCTRLRDCRTVLKRTVEDGVRPRPRARRDIGLQARGLGPRLSAASRTTGAVIDGVMWKAARGGSRFAPEDGIEVIATRQADHLSRPLANTRSSSSGWSSPARAR